ncbi:hypothetical protein GCM10011572_05600 [Pseudoduganella buxea]|uniref:Uncharacterized protein n=1 Tax=Pseudoduganella buxea TaxID=1949069 RepID=A0ABQ1K3I9_9BURK|nr:hypothetical protein GCM10011572_05600 [Pseudoduganella buxea]
MDGNRPSARARERRKGRLARQGQPALAIEVLVPGLDRLVRPTLEGILGARKSRRLICPKV